MKNLAISIGETLHLCEICPWIRLLRNNTDITMSKGTIIVIWTIYLQVNSFWWHWIVAPCLFNLLWSILLISAPLATLSVHWDKISCRLLILICIFVYTFKVLFSRSQRFGMESCSLSKQEFYMQKRNMRFHLSSYNFLASWLHKHILLDKGTTGMWQWRHPN